MTEAVFFEKLGDNLYEVRKVDVIKYVWLVLTALSGLVAGHSNLPSNIIIMQIHRAPSISFDLT